MKITRIPIEKINPHIIFKVLQVIKSKVKSGHELFIKTGGETFEDFFKEDFKESPLFLVKNKDFITEYFSNIICTVPFSYDEFEAVCLCLEDSNKVCLESRIKDKVSGTLTIEQIVTIDNAISDLMAEIWLTPVNIAEQHNKHVVEHCKSVPTLGNQLYLYLYG